MSTSASSSAPFYSSVQQSSLTKIEVDAPTDALLSDEGRTYLPGSSVGVDQGHTVHDGPRRAAKDEDVAAGQGHRP